MIHTFCRADFNLCRIQVYSLIKYVHTTVCDLESFKSDKKKTIKTQDRQKTCSKDVNTSENALETKTLEFGITVKDLQLGKGVIAKSGKRINIYYTGYLKENNKIFDSVTKGKGLKFNLGRGEVIKGLDVGVPGMKVGGKRVITCPPNAAYGSKGSPPTIPGNSTLVFEIELNSVS